jgi:hypothetical protein
MSLAESNAEVARGGALRPVVLSSTGTLLKRRAPSITPPARRLPLCLQWLHEGVDENGRRDEQKQAQMKHPHRRRSGAICTSCHGNHERGATVPRLLDRRHLSTAPAAVPTILGRRRAIRCRGRPASRPPRSERVPSRSRNAPAACLGCPDPSPSADHRGGRGLGPGSQRGRSPGTGRPPCGRRHPRPRPTAGRALASRWRDMIHSAFFGAENARK